MDESYLEFLLTTNKPFILNKDEYLFRQGDAGGGMYVVLNGKLEVILEYDSENHVVAIIEESSFLGEISIMSDVLKRTASVKAIEQARLFYLDADIYKQQVAAQNVNALRIGYNISLELAKRLTKTNELIRSMQKKPEIMQMPKEIAKFRDLLLSEVLL